MDHYLVELQGVKVKVSVVDDATLIDRMISEMRASLETARPVMGLDIKGITIDAFSKASMLLICAVGRCLILPNLYNLFNYYPGYFGITKLRLLADPNICFLGIDLERKIKLRHNGKSMCDDLMKNEGVYLGYFAARILKKPNLESAKLPELAAEVGIDVKPPSDPRPGGCDARVFTQEGIEHAVHDVYTSYLIGKKLALGLE